MKSCSFLAPFWPPYGAMAPLWHPFGRLVESFWLAFSAFERLEPQREPFQPRFYDLVSFLVPFRSNFVKCLRFLTELLKVVWFLLCILFLLHVLRLILLLLPFLLLACWLLRACERSEAERGRCWLDVWMDGWLDGLLDGCPLPLLHFIVLSVFACSGFHRFRVDSGTPFWEFFGHLRQTIVFFFMLVSRSLFSNGFGV